MTKMKYHKPDRKPRGYNRRKQLTLHKIELGQISPQLQRMISRLRDILINKVAELYGLPVEVLTGMQNKVQ